MELEYRSANFNDLLGKTLVELINNNDLELRFICSDGTKYKMEHFQECVENVYIDDIVGDLNDIIGSEILKASEDTSFDEQPRKKIDIEADFDMRSFTWTFYNIATIKGHVTIRWYGQSSGYYSESVNFYSYKEKP